jgi:hypothetical protein
MTSDDRFDGTVSGWLQQRAGTGAPDYLDDILGRTARTRQRPGWTFIERWPPMDVAMRRSVIPRANLRAMAALALLALLIAAIAVYALGTQRRLPPPFGPARNGELLSSADGDIFAVDPRSGQTKSVIAGPTNDFGPMFSRDGTKFLFLGGGRDNGLDIVVANPDGSEAHVVTQVVNGPDWVDWSPDGTRIAFLSRTLDRGEINIVNVDGSGSHTLDVGQPANEFSWLPTEGDEIVFRGEHQADSDPPPAILAVRPDGTGLRTMSTRAAVDANDFQDVAVSQDGTRVAYRYPGPDVFSVRVLDLQTGTERTLPQPPDTAQFGGPFSPDGRSLLLIRAYDDRTVQLVVVPADGSGMGVALGPRAPGGSGGPSINNQVWSADGTAVIANYDAEKLNRLVPIDGSPPTVLTRGELAFGAYQRLAP